MILKLTLLFRAQAVTDLGFNSGCALPTEQVYFLTHKEPLEPSVFLSVKWGEKGGGPSNIRPTVLLCRMNEDGQ